MPLVSWLRRWLLLALTFFLPLSALGAAWFGTRGAIAGALLAATALLAVALTAERGLLRAYGARRPSDPGLNHSLARVLARLGGRAPQALAFGDPAPQLLVARGPGGPGVILVSEGLLGILEEDELRAVLEAGVLRLRARGAGLQTLCAWLAHLSLELAPRPWVELLFGELRWHERLGVLGSLRFMAAFSTARHFARLGRFSAVAAPHPLRHLPNASGELVNPGSGILHFHDPWISRSLFPL